MEHKDLNEGQAPEGAERAVVRSLGVTVDGAPVAYMAVLAAVVAVLTLIPLPITIVVGTGKSFPISQGIHPLVGWVLGPLAGALVNAAGAVVGVLINPQNSSSLWGTMLGSALAGLAAGSMRQGGSRSRWWVAVAGVAGLFYALYGGRAVIANGANVVHVLAGSFIDWSAVLLFALPTRAFFGRALASENLSRVAVGLFGGTWLASGLAHLCAATIVYWQVNWPNELWLVFAAPAPFEHIARCLIGAVVGTGVIAGLRALNLAKPEHAAY
ncbi:MAG: ECF transporter S component [Anaerolineae bacterium]|nr:ECF transporter S component [Anaerolineae bacterium]